MIAIYRKIIFKTKFCISNGFDFRVWTRLLKHSTENNRNGKQKRYNQTSKLQYIVTPYQKRRPADGKHSHQVITVISLGPGLFLLKYSN